MNITIYSANSNVFRARDFDVRSIPSCAGRWEEAAAAFPEHKFSIVAARPGAFLLDLEGGELAERAENVEYVVTDATEPADFARAVMGTEPDVAVAATFWTAPFDWLALDDALVGEELSRRGAAVRCNSLSASLDCFDKERTHIRLEGAGFRMPRYVPVKRDLFWAERGRPEILSNVYRNFILERLGRLSYPVVVKDAFGMSSRSLEIAVSPRQAAAGLRSGKSACDRIVEEYEAGAQFGAEVYGSDGRFVATPPFMFSTTRHGVTSPKQSVKLGPIQCGRYQTDELRGTLSRVAREFGLNGAMQLDLVFGGEGWKIIEANSRLSGMTETCAESRGTTVAMTLAELAAEGAPRAREFAPACNIKLPLLDDAGMESVMSLPFARSVKRTRNLAARQEREKGYCEAIFALAPSVGALAASIEGSARERPELFEGEFVKKMMELAKSC